MENVNNIGDERLEAILSDAVKAQQAMRVEARKAEAWAAVEKRIGVRKTTPMWRKALRVAAVMVPFLFAALIFMQRGSGVDAIMYAATTDADTFALPDGSTVVLGKGSQLAFTNGEKSREAKLEGIGLFMVRHDDGCPFTVEAGAAEVRVLGTTFSVEHWPGEERVRTRVEQGHVTVSAVGERVSLLAGEEATFSDGRLVKMASASAGVKIGSREMTFRSASLTQVLEELKTCYRGELKGVKMECSPDSVLITTTFKDQTLASVVEELNMHFDKKLTLRNGYLTISD